MWRSGLAACGLVLFLGAFPVLSQDDAERRIAEAERRAADAERRASVAERRVLEGRRHGEHRGPVRRAPIIQSSQCQADQLNFYGTGLRQGNAEHMGSRGPGALAGCLISADLWRPARDRMSKVLALGTSALGRFGRPR